MITEMLLQDGTARNGGEYMNKIYISQPMAGKTPKEIKTERDTALGDIMMSIGEVLKLANPVVLNMDKGEVWCLGRDIQRLSEAQECFFLPGWQEEPNCRVEHSICEYYDIPICELGGSLEDGFAVPGTCKPLI